MHRRVLLAKRLWRIGEETLWREGGRYFARIENRSYKSEHEIPVDSARRRYERMTDQRCPF